MGRRSFTSTYSHGSRWWDNAEDREYGFMTISNEIDRALLTTSSRASTYLQEAFQAQDTYEVLISDAHGRRQAVEVNEFATVAHLCLLFDPCVDLRIKQLYEEVPDMPGFVRAMEDHELVTRRCVMWSSTFSISRYRLLENRNKYAALAEEKVLSDRSLSLVSLFDDPAFDDAINLVAPKRDNALEWSTEVMNTRSNPAKSIPKYITSGCLWFRTPQHGWRKLFCFLHGSSVFCSLRRGSKAARYMRLIIDLAMVDIFSPLSSDLKLPFKAPTNEVIVCKPVGNSRFDVKTLTVFAARTAEGRIAWQNGFRIHKFGISRLEKNYELACSACHETEVPRKGNRAPESNTTGTNAIKLQSSDFVLIDDDSGTEGSTRF
ncbi:hypothetical protein FGIG_05672 [Fasciola gigantica]|uniref:PH domain-containing protein n=1 Tax=Fasciola gigantica TaxID=46835 RepID=A0A504Y9B5_FASGI|nr:hypothetical protein FGIG_05672 [Fasciola gigantica]